MRAQSYSRRHSFIDRLTPWHRAVVLMVVAVLAPSLGSPPANAADPRIERAQEQRTAAQQNLDAVLARLTGVEAQVAAAEARVAELTARQQAARHEAAQASTTLAHLARASYQQGTVDPALALFSSESPAEAISQLQLLGLMAERSQAGYETASAAGVRSRVAGEAAEEAAETLKERRAELEAVRREAGTLLAAAEQQEQTARTAVAREQAAREARAARAREQAAREKRANRSAPSAQRASTAGSAPASTSGGVACPVGQPRSYSDTYGAARSGGRSHRGTDILAPRGTPIYAYESGTITRLNSNRLGGISLYLRGDGGNVYYYTHLQGYVSGLSGGQRVQGGQQIAYNGDTGNARGIPHLHFEVMPGGGSNVNPYPYVRRACG